MAFIEKLTLFRIISLKQIYYIICAILFVQFFNSARCIDQVSLSGLDKALFLNDGPRQEYPKSDAGYQKIFHPEDQRATPVNKQSGQVPQNKQAFAEFSLSNLLLSPKSSSGQNGQPASNRKSSQLESNPIKISFTNQEDGDQYKYSDGVFKGLDKANKLILQYMHQVYQDLMVEETAKDRTIFAIPALSGKHFFKIIPNM